MQVDTTSDLTIKKSIEFIAKDLILHKVIEINDSSFSLIDIEVYYWHEKHKDDFTKGVNHNRPLGEFEAHRYGIDISLGNHKNIEFGGILICGLFDIKNNLVIEKSSVQRTLINSLNNGNNTIKLVSNTNSWREIFKSKRLNLGAPDNDNKKKYVDSCYKFLAKNSSIFEKYKGKEAIFKNSNLSDSDIIDILGYNITR